MAKQTVVVDLKTNTGDSVNSIKQLNSEMNQLQKNAKKTGETLDKAVASPTLEQQLNELNRQIDSGELNFQQMTKAIKDYQTIAFKAGATSPVGTKAIAQAADLRDRLADLDTRTRQLSSDYAKMDAALQGASAAMGGFSAFQGVATLMGSENEELMQTMVKLQAATSALNGIQAVRNALNKDSMLVQQAQIAMNRIQTSGVYAWATAQKVAAVSTGLGTKAMKLFRLALIATGIGAIVVGIGLLIANFDKLLAIFKPVIDGFKKIGDMIGLTNFKEKELAEARKARHKANMSRLQEERRELEKNRKANQKNAKLEKRWSDSRIKDLELQAKEASLNGKETIDIVKQITAEKIAQYEREKAAFIQDQKDILAENRNTEAKLLSTYQNRTGNTAKVRKQLNEIKEKNAELEKQIATGDLQTLTEIEQQINNVRLDAEKAEKEHLEKRRQRYQKARDERLAKEKAFQDELLKLRQEEFARMNSLLDEIAQVEEEFQTSARDKEINTVTDKYFRLIEEAKNYGQDVTILEQARDAEVKKLRDGFAKEDLERARNAQNMIEDNRIALMQEGQDKEIAALQEKYSRERIAIQENETLTAQEKLQLVTQLQQLEEQELNRITEENAEKRKEIRLAAFNAYSEEVIKGIGAISTINEIASDIAIRNAEGNQKKQEQIARKAFAVNKSLQLASATVQGTQAVLNAYASAQASPITPFFPGYPAVAAGVAAAVASANIAKIAASRFQGGGSVSAPSGGGVQGASASSFSIGANTDTEQTNLNPDGTQANGNGGMVKVFVAESDITETQDNVKQINTLSTF